MAGDMFKKDADETRGIGLLGAEEDGSSEGEASTGGFRGYDPEGYKQFEGLDSPYEADSGAGGVEIDEPGMILAGMGNMPKTDEEKDAEEYYDQLRAAEEVLERSRGKMTDDDFLVLSKAKNEMNLKFAQRGLKYRAAVLELVDKRFAGEVRGLSREFLAGKIEAAVEKYSRVAGEENRIARQKTAEADKKNPIVDQGRASGFFGMFRR